MKQIIKNPKLFTANRQKFMKAMLPNSIAVFQSNEHVIANGDTFFPYEQNSDLYWLTGIEQEETSLVLFPSNNEKKYTEVLFIQEPIELREKWEGKKLQKEDARQISGIQHVFWISQMDSLLLRWIHQAEHVYLDSNENDRKPVSNILVNDYAFIQQFKARFPLHQYHRAAKILRKLRAVKSADEIALVQKAIDITHLTFLEILKVLKHGIPENEIEALIYYHFLKQNSPGPAYHSIIASGDNARILHYIENNNICKDGELVLMDFGAKWAGYKADLTRTVPVNGKFSARQKEVYNACLHLHKYAKSILKPGIAIVDYHDKVGDEATKQFKKIGLLTDAEIKNGGKENPPYRKYLYHGISHHLGIDVHDLGSYTEKITEGMLFTIEPGIYIEQEKIGIRIENNVWITRSGNKDLMSKIPIEVGDIENCMKKK